MLIFIFIIFLGNFASSVIGILITESEMTSEFSGSLTRVLNTVKEVYEKEGASAEDIEKLYTSGFVDVKFYSDANKLAEDFNLSAEDINAVGGSAAAFHGKGKKGFDLNIPISIVKSGNTYIVSAIRTEDGMFTDFRIMISMYNLLSILCGTIVMLIAARLIVKPIKKLTAATEKIARGDFEVHIKKERKDEIGQLVDNFNKMTKELAGMEMMRNNFISDISHEFKTPLTSIEGYTKLLRDCKDDAQRNEYIDIITAETKRLSALSGNILLLNRIENENITTARTPFRLDEQIRHVILLSENKWSGKNLELNIDLEEVTYTGNEPLLFQVWLNLFDNAIKFSNPGEAIEISLKKQEGKIAFTIMDYGKGIAGEQQKRMFEKFYMGDKSRTAEGNGLGLSIVKRIVDMHGGTIEVQSRQDEFTIIKIIL